MAIFGRPRSKRLSPVRLRRTEARILESRRSDRDSWMTECLIASGGGDGGRGLHDQWIARSLLFIFRLGVWR